MAFVDVLGDVVHMPKIPTGISGGPNLTTSSAITIDGASEGVAGVMQAPKTGNISQIMFITGGTVTTGATMDVRLESVDESATPSRPGGLLATNTNASCVIANGETNTIKTVTLTAAGAVTRGQLIAVHVQNPASSFGNLKPMGTFGEEGGNNTGLPYTLQNQSGTWSTAENSGALLLALGYDDGTWCVPDGFYMMSSIDATSFSTSSTPDAKGARFTITSALRLNGVWFWLNNSNGCSVKLVQTNYNQGTNANVIHQWDIDKDTKSQAVGTVYKLVASSDIELDPGTYRLICEPTTASTIQVYHNVIPTVGIFNALRGANWHYTSAKDPTQDSDWTNYNNINDGYRTPWCGLIINGHEVEYPEVVLSDGSLTNAKFAANAITASVLHSDVTTELQSGLATQASVDTVDTVVDAIKAKTDNLPSDPADASDIASSFSTVNTKLDAIDDFVDTEVAAILAAVDTEVAAIKAKTDNLPASPAATGDIPSAATIADSVWDEVRSGHVSAGSFGEGVASVQGNVTGSVDSVTGNVGGNVVGSVDSVVDPVTVGTNNDKTGYALVYQSRTGTAQAGAAGSITLDASASATTDFYKGLLVLLSGGTGSGQTRRITAYNGTTKVATVAPNWATNPDNTSVFYVVPDGNVIVETNNDKTGYTATPADGSITNAKFGADAITASVLASDVTTEIQNGLATAASLTTVEGKVDTVDTVVDAIKAKTDNLPTDPADASVIAGEFTSLNTKIDTIDDLIDTEMAATLAAVDTEVAAIKAKTDNLPAAPAAVGDIPTAIQNATALLTRSIDSDEGSATAKCLLWLIALALNQSAVAGGSITVKKTDNSTNLFTQSVTQTSVNPITSKGEAS